MQADHLALLGTALTLTTTPTYEVHETVTADGSRIRQYVNHQGVVFAVGWSARFQPNLRQLLAAHYREYLAAARGHHGSHHVLSVSTPGLVLGIVQLPRSSAGSAHVPALLPPAVKPGELR